MVAVRTLEIVGGEVVDQFRAHVCATHLDWRLDLDEDSVPGDRHIRRYELGGVQLVECTAGRCRGARGRREIAALDQDYVGVLYLDGGGERISRGRTTVALSRGEALPWDARLPARFEVHPGVRKYTLLIPWARARGLWASPEELTARGVLGRDEAGLLGGFIRSVVSLPEAALRRQDGVALGEAALEILAAATSTVAPGAPASGDARRLRLAQDYLEAHLRDPAVGVAQVADALGLSVRSVYALFSRRGLTVHGYLQDRRLARARLDLLRGDGPIGTIALRWGFPDHSTFSRLFKRTYGLSPRELRSAAGS